MLLAVCCLGFVVFGTSKQSLSGLKHVFLKGPPPGRELAPHDQLLGKIVLFFAFLSLTGIIMLFFSVVPLYRAKGERRLTSSGRKRKEEEEK